VKTKIFIWLVPLVLLIRLNVMANNELPVVYINGGELSYTGQGPVLESGRVLIPARDLFEALGAEVFWDDSARTVTAVKAETVIRMTIGSKTVYKNDEEIQLDVAPLIINSRTMIPLRFACEAFGNKVNYAHNENTVYILNDIIPESFEYQGKFYFSTGKAYFPGETGSLTRISNIGGFDLYNSDRSGDEIKLLKTADSFLEYREMVITQ